MSSHSEVGLDERLREASDLVEEGQWEDALAILMSEEEAHKTDPALLCMLGAVSAEVGATAGMSYDYYRRCLSEEPQDAAVLVALGSGLARYDDPDAEGVLRLAAITAPALPQARLQYGAYLAREGLLDAALAELEAARALDGEDPAVFRELATAYLLAGDEMRGVEQLEVATDLSDDSEPEIRLLYGLALLKARKPEEAAEELHRAAASLPDDGEAQLLSALASASREWWDDAWDALARAEGAGLPPDQLVLREAEESMDAGAPAAAALLRDQLAPPILRERLMLPS
jgi:Flp pilus assembly protein TadD